MTLQIDANTILLVINIIIYGITFWYQSKRITYLEKSREDIKLVSDQMKSHSDMMKNYADMINIDDIKKYIDLKTFNLSKEVEDLKDTHKKYETVFIKLFEENPKFRAAYQKLLDEKTNQTKTNDENDEEEF